MFEQVLVAVDGSSTGKRGLEAAIGLAADQKATLTILHVVDATAGTAYVGDMLGLGAYDRSQSACGARGGP